MKYNAILLFNAYIIIFEFEYGVLAKIMITFFPTEINFCSTYLNVNEEIPVETVKVTKNIKI